MSDRIFALIDPEEKYKAAIILLGGVDEKSGLGPDGTYRPAIAAYADMAALFLELSESTEGHKVRHQALAAAASAISRIGQLYLAQLDFEEAYTAFSRADELYRQLIEEIQKANKNLDLGEILRFCYNQMNENLGYLGELRDDENGEFREPPIETQLPLAVGYVADLYRLATEIYGRIVGVYADALNGRINEPVNSSLFPGLVQVSRVNPRDAINMYEPHIRIVLDLLDKALSISDKMLEKSENSQVNANRKDLIGLHNSILCLCQALAELVVDHIDDPRLEDRLKHYLPSRWKKKLGQTEMRMNELKYRKYRRFFK